MLNKYFLLLFLIVIGLLFSGCNSDIQIVGNNSSEYKIVIPAQSTEIENMASEELQKYLFEISNTKLRIVKDSELETPFEILVGRTNRIESKLDSDALAEDGYIIKTIREKLIIQGGTNKGTLYGVYTFLDEILGCKMYTPEVMNITKANDIQIPQLSIQEIPIVRYRELHIPSARSSQEFCDWHKLHHVSVRNKSYGSFVHTFQHLIPPEKYFRNHPEYFSEINGIRIDNQQVCLTNPEVYKVVLNELKRQMEIKPDAVVWDISQNDNFGNCTCESCSKSDSIYKSPSGTMIEFVNKFAREFPNKTISTLAYQYTRKAPVGIKPEPNVMVVLCTIECDRSKPIAENKDDLFNRDIKEWSALTNNIKIWDYVVQFSSYTDPFPNFHVLQPNIKMFVDHGIQSLFTQGSGDSYSDLHELKAYVLAKLMWNPDANVDDIINEFLTGFYGNAGPYIRTYFDKIHKAIKDSNKGLIIYGYPTTGMDSYLTPSLLKAYSQIFDEAENSVKDKAEYLERVKFARLPLEYAILEIAKRNASEELYIFKINEKDFTVNPKMKDRLTNFVNLANKAGIKNIHERGTTPDEYLNSMQSYFKEGIALHKAYKKGVKLLAEPHPNYSVEGGKTLSDGIKGEANYFFNWLGFEATEFEAVVDLQSEINITNIRTDFLQEVKSWIWLPKKVEYFVSVNGVDFKKIGEVKNEIDTKRTGIFTQPFILNTNTKAKYVKVKTESLITPPKWHLGYDNGRGKAFIFIDEIVIN
jgi:hypothetical protein